MKGFYLNFQGNCDEQKVGIPNIICFKCSLKYSRSWILNWQEYSCAKPVGFTNILLKYIALSSKKMAILSLTPEKGSYFIVERSGETIL